MSTVTRRMMLQGACASIAFSSLPRFARAEELGVRTFEPKPGAWRNFEVVTTVRLRDPSGKATVWVPVPAINTRWQRSLMSEVGGNAAQATIETDARSGARFVAARFDAATPSPELRVTSRVQTMDRAIHGKPSASDIESAEALRRWIRPTALVPTDGIVRKTANQIVGSAQWTVRRPLPRRGAPRAGYLWGQACAQRLWLQAAGSQLPEPKPA